MRRKDAVEGARVTTEDGVGTVVEHKSGDAYDPTQCVHVRLDSPADVPMWQGGGKALDFDYPLRKVQLEGV